MSKISITPAEPEVNHLSLPVPFTVFSKQARGETDKQNGVFIKDGTLGKLLKLCQLGTTAPTKQQASGWAQGQYFWDIRRIANLRLPVACVGLDIDNEMRVKVDGKDKKVRVPDDQILTVDAMIELLKGREFIIYTTFRCTSDHPKFRIMLPLSRPVGTRAYRGVWESMAKALGVLADPAAKDISRLWYLSNPNPQVCPNFRVEYQAGKLWEVEPIVFEVKRKTSMYVPTGDVINADQPKKLEWATKYANKCPPAVAGADGHRRTFNVVCNVVRGFALSEREALLALEQWNSSCDPPWSEDELLHKINNACESGRTPAWGSKLERKGRSKPRYLEFTVEDYEAATGMRLEGF